MSAIVSCSNLTKSFVSGNETLTVLNDINLSIDEGETCAIVGPSGSGKSTLLTIMAGLDRPTSGEVTFDGRSLTSLDEEGLARLRSTHIGFIFQSFQLLSGLTALENVQVPLEILGKRNARDEAEALLANVGLGKRLDHYASQLSGGEQQRVAIARAFIHRPKVLFADEPTGNLDRSNATLILEYFHSLSEQFKTALVLVTHDREVAEQMGRIIKIKDGALLND